MKQMLAQKVSGAPVLNAAGKLARGGAARHAARRAWLAVRRAAHPTHTRFLCAATHSPVLAHSPCFCAASFIHRLQVGVLSETDILWKEAGSPQARARTRRGAVTRARPLTARVESTRPCAPAASSFLRRTRLCLSCSDACQSPSPLSAFLPQDEWIIPPIMIPFMDQVVAWVRPSRAATTALR
jgi:hypothetical protein